MALRESSFDLHSAGPVAVATGPARYDASPPYSPAAPGPEYPFAGAAPARDANHAYQAVREALRLFGLDAEHFGTCQWNPLGEFVCPGDTVLLKPNFVRDFRETRVGHGDCIITHGAVIRAVLDYVTIALGGGGRIIIADAPQNDADFDAIRRISGLDEIQAFYRRHADLQPEIHDLRPERAEKIDGVIVGHTSLSGDPAGYVKVNLGPRSAFSGIADLCRLLYGSEYDTRELHRHQHDDVHEYLVSRTVLEADVVIGLPKLKTHKKVGLTVNLKNLVGINGNKNWLPHYREGTPAMGGDQFADNGLKRRIERSAVARFKRLFPWMGPLRGLLAGPVKAAGRRLFGDTDTGTIRSGNWHGNDTAWRMVLDLNRILMYADADGRLHDRPVRRFFSLVDGIVAGEGNGPLDPSIKPCGLCIAGFNPVAVDLVCARLMGFDYQRLPILREALADHPLPLACFDPREIEVRSNLPEFDRGLGCFEGRCLDFEPHFGWKGHVELDEARTPAGSLLAERGVAT